MDYKILKALLGLLGLFCFVFIRLVVVYGLLNKKLLFKVVWVMVVSRITSVYLKGKNIALTERAFHYRFHNNNNNSNNNNSTSYH